MQQQGGRRLVQRWRVSLWISCEHICKALRGQQAGLTGRLEVACQIEVCRAAQASLCTMCGGKLARLPGPLQLSAPFRLVYCVNLENTRTEFIYAGILRARWP